METLAARLRVAPNNPLLKPRRKLALSKLSNRLNLLHLNNLVPLVPNRLALNRPELMSQKLIAT